MILTSASGAALPTLGYGSTSPTIASFGFGCDDSTTSTSDSDATLYSSSGRYILPIARQSSGPLIIKKQVNGNYRGRYYTTAIALQEGRSLHNVQWEFKAETVTSIGPLQLRLHEQGSGLFPDKRGYVVKQISINFDTTLDLYDQTGTQGKRISVWAIGGSGYITNRVDLEYRILE